LLLLAFFPKNQPVPMLIQNIRYYRNLKLRRRVAVATKGLI